MATNNIKPFATGEGANVLTDSELASRSELQTGFPFKSKADSKLMGKLIQDASAGAYTLGSFTVKYSYTDVSGSNAEGLATSFEDALTRFVKQKAPIALGDWYDPLTIEELDNAHTDDTYQLRIVQDSGYTQIFAKDQYGMWHPVSFAFTESMGSTSGDHTFVPIHAITLLPGISGKMGRNPSDTSETYAGIYINPSHNDYGNPAQVTLQTYQKENALASSLDLYANSEESNVSQASLGVGTRLGVNINGVYAIYNKEGDGAYYGAKSGIYFKDENINNGDYIGLKEFALKSDVTSKVNLTGSRGSLAGYESITVGSTAITINQDSPDSQQVTSAVAITVSDGTSDYSWVKKVSIKDAGVTISLGSAWVWAGGSQPTVTAPSLLVLSWDNDCGIAVLQTTA